MSQVSNDGAIPLSQEMIEQTFEHFGLALAIFIGSQDFKAAQAQIGQNDIDVIISMWFQKPALVIAELLDANEAAISTTIDMLIMEGSSKDAEINQLKDQLKVQYQDGYNTGRKFERTTND